MSFLIILAFFWTLQTLLMAMKADETTDELWAGDSAQVYLRTFK